MVKAKQATLTLICLTLTSVGWGACMDKAKTDEEVNVCQHTLAKEMEYKYKSLVKQIQGKFKGQQLQRFNAAQQHWQQMMDRDCLIEANFYEGAPIYPGILSGCLENHYRERIEHIKNYLCPEQSMSRSCPRAESFMLQN